MVAATAKARTEIDEASAPALSVYQATLAEPNQRTGEVSTEEVRRILVDGSAIVLDTRKRAQYAAGHLPGARNVAPAADAPPAEYIAAVERLVGGDKAKPLVLYCNGPFCRATRQLSEQLVDAGFRNVRRYQVGIPIWRALGGPTQVELEGIVRIFGVDRTAVYFDARSPAEYAQGSLPGAHNVPADRAAAEGFDFAPLPRDDFITRIVVFGRDGAQARALADALAKSPFHNVTFFAGTYAELAAAIQAK